MLVVPAEAIRMIGRFFQWLLLTGIIFLWLLLAYTALHMWGLV